MAAKIDQLVQLLWILGNTDLVQELCCGKAVVTPYLCQVTADFLADVYPDGFCVERTWMKTRGVVFKSGVPPVVRAVSHCESLVCMRIDDEHRLYAKPPVQCSR
ncbi:MAG: hypothetical protein GY725_24930 [bacterium]|nr:hypothetical protein [bacterium]